MPRSVLFPVRGLSGNTRRRFIAMFRRRGEHTARHLTRSWQGAVRRVSSETQGDGSAEAGTTGTASDNDADVRWGLQGCWGVKRCPLGIAGLLGGGDAVHRKSRGHWATPAPSVRGRAVGWRRCHPPERRRGAIQRERALRFEWMRSLVADISYEHCASIKSCAGVAKW